MQIAEFLSQDAVIDTLTSHDKEGVLGELCERLVELHPEFERRELLRVLHARERMGTTGLGEGVAIPHGRLGGLRGLVGCFGRSREGVDFGALDGKPARLIFLLLAPEAPTGMHLKALARISRLLRNPGLRGEILQAEHAEEIHRRIVAADGG
jgi:PTS system nitrogen regulatory IIA component